MFKKTTNSDIKKGKFLNLKYLYYSSSKKQKYNKRRDNTLWLLNETETLSQSDYSIKTRYIGDANYYWAKNRER